MRAQIARLVLIAGMLASLTVLTGAVPNTRPAAVPRAGAHAPATVAMDWQDELVDKRGQVGQGSSIALDSDGHPHIAYYDATQHGLNYAAWDGVAWTLDTVERDLGATPVITGAGPFPMRSGIGFFGGTTYIVYQKFDAQTGGGYLRLAMGGPGSWTISTIGPVYTYTLAYAPSLRLDANHNLHLSYSLRDLRPTAVVPDQIMYARRDYTDTSWLIQPVMAPSCCEQLHVSSLALDPANHPQIAASESANDLFSPPLQWARWNAGLWLTQTVAVNGFLPSLAVDQAGHPHLTYLDTNSFPDTVLDYATLSGATWLTQTVAGCNGCSAPSLALDALDHPHIAFNNLGLQVLSWDGAHWTTAALPPAASAGYEPMLALDAAGNAHISYMDLDYQDLHHVAWGPAWITQTVAVAGSQPSLAVDKHANPYIAYQDTQLKLAHWAGAAEWQYQTAAASASYNALQLQYGADQKPLPIISYQDAAFQSDLAEWTGTAFVTETVDHGSNTGYDGSLALNGPNPVVAFFERSTNTLEYAAETSPGGWVVRNDTAQPPSNAQSGAQALSLGVAPNCCVSFIAYRDGVSQTLRLARWDGTYWTDQVVDAKGDTGLHASLAVDRASGQPAIAYFDATHHTLKYAFWRNGWVSDTVDNLLQNVTGISLQLGLGSDSNPRIAYSVQADNSLRLAWTTSLTGTWTIDTVATFAGSPPPAVSERVQQRDQLAFSLPGGGIGYAFRAATLPYDLDYNPLQPCVEPAPDAARFGPALARVRAQVAAFGPAAAAQLDDLDTLRALRDLFALSPGGQHYINLYYTYAAQTGALGIADPALAWDAYRTLQNFLPGGQALLAGQGDQVTITQSMVDQANNILDRLSAAGTPGLQSAIAAERAKYNHLQAFSGQSFAAAAALLGVSTHHIFLPLVSRH